MTDAPLDVTIGEIVKNSREVIRASLQEFKGHRLASLRVWASDGKGGSLPTKSGLNVRVGQLDDVIALLTKARDEARARGLIE